MTRHATHTADKPGERARLTVNAVAMLGGLLILFTASDVIAKPARPEAPSWRALSASKHAPALAVPRNKKPTTPRWQTSTEPATTASVDAGAGAVPLPEKNPLWHDAASFSPAAHAGPVRPPAKIAARLASTAQPGDSKLLSMTEEKLSPMDVVTTEVVGEEDKENAKAVETAEQPPVAAQIGEGSASKQYCTNVSTAANDARFTWQKKTLLQTEQEVAKRVAELDQRIAEFQRWQARRDEFSRKAEAAVVNIYAKMKPDAAAQQLTVIDEEIAAAVLTKLDPRVASSVMNEMEPKRAARLAAIITGASKGPGKSPGVTPAPPTPSN